jgi:hypothetical protein
MLTTCNAVLTVYSVQYNDGIPKGSRLSNHGSIFQDVLHSFNTEEGNAKINKVKELSKIAEQGSCAHGIPGSRHIS